MTLTTKIIYALVSFIVPLGIGLVAMMLYKLLPSKLRDKIEHYHDSN